MTQQQTIYALATPAGKGGVAVIRVSGPQAYESLKNIAPHHKDFPPRRAVYARFIDPVSRETIDRGLALFFRAPHSFTGEDIVEYHLHGGAVLVQDMLAVLSRQKNHIMAQPGEFTRRAFENGKLDLTEAEAVADLIDAETSLQKMQALHQLEGGLSEIYEGWGQTLKKALAHLEADLEFPDEGLPDGVAPQILPVLDTLIKEIALHLDDNKRGEKLRGGIHIAVIGAPNAGKSSLVNRLAARDVAIVSPQAGTTRDIIEVPLDIGGYKVILSDTAGLRPNQLARDHKTQNPQDSIESEGIKRALERARQADIRLLLFDAAALPVIDSHTQNLINDSALLVFNKCDSYAGVAPPPLAGALKISAKTGAGLEELIAALSDKIASVFGACESPSLTRARHRDALQECRSALKRALQAKLPELITEDVRLALRSLGRITGRVDVEDLLDVIFKDFCIGK